MRPDSSNLGGTFHLAPVEAVATSIAAAVTADGRACEENALQIVNNPGMAAVRADLAASYTEELVNKPDNEAVLKLAPVSMLHWVGQAKRAGLFQWLFTSQESVVTGEDGRKVVSRR